jgi:hypothetical protein
MFAGEKAPFQEFESLHLAAFARSQDMSSGVVILAFDQVGERLDGYFITYKQQSQNRRAVRTRA